MNVRSLILSPSVARGLAAVCAAVFVTTAHPARAGVNVWTSHGPPGGSVGALAIDPITPRTLYAGAERCRRLQEHGRGRDLGRGERRAAQYRRLRPGH